jgi:hypothetical protein
MMNRFQVLLLNSTCAATPRQEGEREREQLLDRDRSMIFHQGECSYRRADSVHGRVFDINDPLPLPGYWRVIENKYSTELGA